MKSRFLPFVASLFLVATGYSDQSQTSNSVSEATAGASAAGVQSSSSKKSVTVSSDGKNTIKRTVTVVDGIEKVVTETTDENGNTTRKESGNSETGGPAENKGGPWLGIRVREVSKTLRGQLDLAEDEGLDVELVAADGPADKAGVREGDLLLAVGESSVSSSAELATALRRHEVGEKVQLAIMRKSKRSAIDVELGEPPAVKDRKAPEGLADGFGKIPTESVDILVDGADVGKVFDTVLDDPNLPDSFKESVRKMQKTLRDFEKHSGE